MTDSDKQGDKSQVINFECICGKKYKYRQGLSYHKSKCMFKDKESITQNLSQEFVLDVIKKQQDQITELRFLLTQKQSEITSLQRKFETFRVLEL